MFIYLMYSALCSLVLIKLLLLLTTGIFRSNISLSGKTALITGGNSGMGYELSKYFASRGCRVIIADVDNAERTVKTIKKLTKNHEVVYQYLDLASLTSVRKCAANIIFTERRLDILVNNAGCAGFTQKTEDDLYKVFQVNYLGHFLLTLLLTPLLINTKHSRIVFVSSLLAFFNNLSIDKHINTLTTSRLPVLGEIFDYGNSKMCILATTRVLARKMEKHGVVVSSCHPGIVKTQMFRQTFENVDQNENILIVFAKMVICFGIAIFGKTPEEGIQSALYCAISEDVKPGDFIVDCQCCFQPLQIYNAKFCKYVWRESLKLAEIEKTIEFLEEETNNNYSYQMHNDDKYE